MDAQPVSRLLIDAQLLHAQCNLSPKVGVRLSLSVRLPLLELGVSLLSASPAPSLQCCYPSL
jgi:hypothetical protein